MTTVRWGYRYLLGIGFALFAGADGLAAQVASTTAVDTAAVLASARPDIAAANAAWLPGLRQRNAAAIVEPYADSGLFIQADGTVIRGRAAIAKMYEDRFPRLQGIRDGAIVQDGLGVVNANTLVEWGHGWLELAPRTAGGPPLRSGGPYLTIWQRMPDGHWRIIRNLTF